MRNGVEIWVEKEKADKLQQALTVIRQSTFIHFENQTINTADIVGIFSAGTMADHTSRKNGQWKCEQGYWHDRGVKCDCVNNSTRARNLKLAEAIAKCGKCNNGWIYGTDTAKQCDCIKDL